MKKVTTWMCALMLGCVFTVGCKPAEKPKDGTTGTSTGTAAATPATPAEPAEPAK